MRSDQFKFCSIIATLALLYIDLKQYVDVFVLIQQLKCLFACKDPRPHMYRHILKLVKYINDLNELL